MSVLSNAQFRPRRMSSGNTAPKGKTVMVVPKTGRVAVKRNPRGGQKVHWAGGG